jgi:hypothetical protein
MRRIISILLLAQSVMMLNGQIIADHHAVDEFENIPAEYIAEVKKMMVAFPGESHSAAMRTGLELLEELDPTYACNVGEGEAYTDQYLRVENYGWIGELEWFTWFAYDEPDRPYPVEREFKYLMERYKDAGHPITALGFTWCYDMTLGEGNETAEVDPVYGVHWYGASDGGPDGNKAWGLDADDYAITGNRVSLQTYFDTMEDYIAHVKANNLGTKMIFTTGTVDPDGQWFGEGAIQGHIKHEAIRDYVKADPSLILFDYADILCYDDDGTMNTLTWNGHTVPAITLKNNLPQYDGHISKAGAIRLAKAQWWLLARIAGWNSGSGGPTAVTEQADDQTALVVVASKDSLTISINDFDNSSTVRLYDMRGALRAVKRVDSSSCCLNISHLPSGLYIIVLSAPDSIITREVYI